MQKKLLYLNGATGSKGGRFEFRKPNLVVQLTVFATYENIDDRIEIVLCWQITAEISFLWSQSTAEAAEYLTKRPLY